MADEEEQGSPVAIHGRRLACENSVLRAYFDHIVEGDREVANYMVVTSVAQPGEPLTATGVSVLPVNANGELGLQKAWRHPVSRWTWEVPRGFIDAGETPEQAAIRELQEEAGLLCPADKLVALGAVLPEAGVIRGRNALFAATQFIRVAASGDEIGIGGLHWFAAEQALAMADRSVIEESTTLAVLYRWARYQAAQG